MTESTEQIKEKKEISDDNFKQDILEYFTPVPYLFRIKDAIGNRITLPPEKLSNAKLECPPFHVLLDHLMAVLWAYYSKNGIELLESSQIHWALKILEGTKNKYGQYTNDVKMAIEHLIDAFTKVCSRIDLEKLESRTYDPPTYERLRKKRKTADSFQMKDNSPDADSEKSLLELRNTSLHLADMISDADPNTLDELMASKQGDGDGLCIADMEAKVTDENLSEDQKTILTRRNTMFRNVVSMIEEIKRLDDNLSALPDQVNLSENPPALKIIE